jgi:hypothetical protein
MKMWGCGKELEDGPPERKVQHATSRALVSCPADARTKRNPTLHWVTLNANAAWISSAALK